MDAVPMTFGDEASAWAQGVAQAGRNVLAAVNALSQLPLGGTAVGAGIDASSTFGAKVTERLARRFGHPYREAEDHFANQATIDDFVAASAALRGAALCLYKVAGDLRLLSSGPFGGLGELSERQRQSSPTDACAASKPTRTACESSLPDPPRW